MSGVTMIMSSIPEAIAFSTTCWMVGMSWPCNIFLGYAFVAGRIIVPKPAAGVMERVLSLHMVIVDDCLLEILKIF